MHLLSLLSGVLALCSSAALAATVPNTTPAPQAGLLTDEQCSSDYLAEKAAGCKSQYKIEKELGHGFFGTVYKATHMATGKVVALKCKRRGDDDVLIKEFCYQRNARHQFVLEVFHLTCHNNGPCIAMQLADGGSLTDVAAKHEAYLIPEEKARHYFKQWAEGVAHVHSVGMANRDIKPDNVLLVNNEVKMCDFGIACYPRSKYHKYNCKWNALMGTPGYKPDEPGTLFESEPDIRTRDVYALGMAWRELVTGRKPTRVALLDEHKMERRCGLSRELVDLIDHMITQDYKKRFTIEQVLQHPWMTGKKLKGEEDPEWIKRCQLLYEIKQAGKTKAGFDDFGIRDANHPGTNQPNDLAKDAAAANRLKQAKTI